jgi:hypothetical protein
MQEHYGIDLSEPGLLDRKSARWLWARVGGLLAISCRLSTALRQKDV